MSHVNPQDAPSQVALEFAGGEQGVQDAPQLMGLVLLAQAPLQLWVPTGHEMPQVAPSQVAEPPIGTGHAEQLLPQVITLELLTQTPLHT